MVNSQTQLDNIFQSLSDPIRRDMLLRIAKHDSTISELAKPYNVSLPAISKHVKVLEKAALIERRKIGREYQLSFKPQTFKTAQEHLEVYRRFWNKQFDALEKFLEYSHSQIKVKEVKRNG